MKTAGARRVLLFSSALILAGLCMAPLSQADSSPYDGSKPLICAATEAFECSPNEDCHKGSLEQLNVFRFLRVDFKKKETVGEMPGGTRETSKIDKLHKLEGATLLQGEEAGRGWSLHIDHSTGTMTSSIAGPRVSFVVFGSCVVP